MDLDERLASRAGMSIREIFARHGEAGFRRLETELLGEVIQLKDHVISLGGGAVLAEQNRLAISTAGHAVVYLRAAPEELHRRIVADPVTASQRPSLTRLAGTLEEIRELLAQREPIYQKMKTHELDVNSSDIEQLVMQLKQTLSPTPREIIRKQQGSA